MKWIMELITAWWKDDQIRIGPTVGRLLALDVGDQFVFGSELFSVINRDVISCETENEIVLCLDRSTIRVIQSRRDMTTTATIHRNGITSPSFDDDLMLLRREK